ncbi:M16 family metallopeptidase [Pontibacter sp. MBLB2868]|uniref:M16 family metallopeptidase n=1 Tax=Pontibacter sp. MBLB2868 TaxID=3451555 RepID=UPI003F74CDF5
MLDRTIAPDIHEIDAVSLQIAEVTHLDNGARLHIIKNETQPVIRLDFVFKAGKWYEAKTGVSDLTAKMLMEGTVNYTAKQIAEKIGFFGASMDINHGYDRTELTVYCLSKYIDELLPLMLDILQNPTFPEEEFKLLKKRTLQTLKVQRQKNNYLATHALTKLIYGEDHPYIFGFDEHGLDDVELELLKQYYHEHYSTKDLEIFACGAVDDTMYQNFVTGISKLNLENGIKAESNNANKAIVSETNKKILVETPESLQSSIRIGRSFPLNNSEDYLKLKVMNEIFGGYFGSRLMKNIREDKGYTYGIYSAISPKEHDTLFFIGTDVKSSVTADTISEIKKEIARMQNELVPEEELSTVKNYMLGKFINDVTTIFEQCDRYKKVVLHNLSMDHYNNYITTIRNITPSEIQDLAQRYLNEDSLFTAIAGKN